MTYISGIFGLQGCGKTTLMTWLGLKEYNKGKKLFSNYHLDKVNYTPVTTLNDIEKMKNGVFLGDELWLWVFSRSSMSKINQEIAKIVMLNRKRNVSIIYTSQLHRQVDVLLWDVTNYYYYPEIYIIEDKQKSTMYLTYICKNILGQIISRKVVKKPVEYIGQFFNTYEEIGKLKPKTAIELGYQLENTFYNMIKKSNKMKSVIPLPNSGKNTGLPFDFIFYDHNGLCYLLDIKSSNKTHVTTGYGKTIIKKIKVAKSINAIPLLAFTKNTCKNFEKRKNWFIYKIDGSYLQMLNAHPKYNPMIKKSKHLNTFLSNLPVK